MIVERNGEAFDHLHEAQVLGRDGAELCDGGRHRGRYVRDLFSPDLLDGA